MEPLKILGVFTFPGGFDSEWGSSPPGARGCQVMLLLLLDAHCCCSPWLISQKRALSWFPDTAVRAEVRKHIKSRVKNEDGAPSGQRSTGLGSPGLTWDEWEVSAGQPFSSYHTCCISVAGSPRIKFTCSGFLCNSYTKMGLPIQSAVFWDKYPDRSLALGPDRVYPHFQWPRKQTKTIAIFCMNDVLLDHKQLLAIYIYVYVWGK